MNIKELLPLVSAVFTFILGAGTFYKKNNQKTNTPFAFLAFSITIWLLGVFMLLINRGDKQATVFWLKTIYIAISFIPAFAYHFVLSYIKEKRDIFIYFSYFVSIVLLFLSQTSYLFKEITFYNWQLNICYSLFLSYFFLYSVIWLVKAGLYYKKSDSPMHKKQAGYVLLSLLVLFFVGPMAYLSVYKINNYYSTYLLGLITIMCLSYATNVHVSELKLILRKAIVNFLSIVITVSFFYVSRFVYLDALFIKTDKSIIDLLALVVAMVIFPYIQTYFYFTLDKHIFTSFYDIQKIVSELAEKLNSTIEANKTYFFIEEAIKKAFNNKSFAILIYEDGESGSKFKVNYNNNFDFKSAKKLAILNNEKIKNHHLNTPLIMESFKNEYYKKYKVFIDTCFDLGIELISPLKVQNKIIGIMVLSRKGSYETYGIKDLNLLKVVSNQASVSIENSLFYESIKDFNKKLKVEVEKATNDLVVANEELKKLDSAKSEFISIAAHQLRTPLTVIKGYSSMMLENLFGQLSDPQKENLQKVYEANERLIRLVEDLLNISRIESGRLQFNFEIVQLESTVESIVKELTKAAENKKLILTYEHPATLLPKVKIDQDKIRQVVMNLVDNSIKYTKEGNIVVKLEEVNNKVKFTVKDTGFGISQKDLGNLFKKFSRGTGVSLAHTEGTGLGLYVGKMMIESHQGKIWAESDGEGKGSSFCFELPIAS